MNVGRKQFLVAFLWSFLLLIALGGYWTMRSSRQRLHEAQVQLQTCEKLAKDIKTLGDRPGFAALGVDSPRTITTRAEAAGKKAMISPAALVRIEPQVAVRLRDSDYRVRPTRLELRRVTLKQVLAFTHAMIDETQGTTVRDLRLTASETSSANVKEADSWTAEMVLTQLIFSPQ